MIFMSLNVFIIEQLISVFIINNDIHELMNIVMNLPK